MNTIINIGRQFGSGGKQVAIAIGEKLGIPVYDSELLSKAAEESGFSKDLFVKSDERRSPLSLSSLFSSDRFIHNGGGGINDGELFSIQSQAIRTIAQSGPAIFIGRASDYVLRDMNCLDVFICGPLEARIDRICKRMGVSATEAETMIAKKDRGREAYYNFFTFGNWGVASNYDLCVDSSILGIEGTADFIIEFAKRKGIL